MTHRLGPLPFDTDQLSFSGGGIRCFWHGGALHALQQVQEVKPQRVAASSGGALSAACFLSGCGHELVDVFREQLSRQDRNVEWHTPNDENGLTPHQQLYSDVVHEVLDEEAQARVANGPQFEVMLARPPRGMPVAAAAALTMALYEADKHIRSTPHGKLAEAGGATELRVDAREAAREGKLPELVCIAATIPPVFDIKTWKGDPVIDAGTVDNAPVPEPNEGTTLVMLTRTYRNLPEYEGRSYVYPSNETPADKIDFTDAEALQQTYTQGMQDMGALIAERVSQPNRNRP